VVVEEKNTTSNVEISRQVQDVGNVFQDSKVYFEYVFRKELLQKDEFKDLKDVIFQVQIQYVRNDGAKMLRVLTQKKAITRSKEEVLKNLNMDVLAANASRKAARLCEEGDYEAARANIYSNALWMNRNATNEMQSRSAVTYVQKNLHIDSMMQQEQHTEQREHKVHESKKAQKKHRSRNREDVLAADMYQHKMF